MNKYVLALLVTLEQENAIRKLFGHSGWEYTKIDEVSDDEVSVKKSNTTLLDVRKLEENSQVLDTNGSTTTDLAVDNSVIKSVKQENIGSIADVDESIAGESGEENAEFDGVSDTEKVSDDHDISQNVVNNDIETGKNAVNSRTSDIGKDLAQTELKHVVKKRRKDKAVSGISDNADSCVSETGEEELSVKKQQRNSLHVIQETTKTVKSMSEDVEAEDHDNEVCLDVPDDVDESGYSATLAVYICKECGYKFPEENDYMLHKRDGLCGFSCQFCNKKYMFRNFTEYQTHLMEHSDDNSCGKCGKRLSTKQSLKHHLMLHEGGHQFKCKVCDKSYLAKDRLDRHMAVHTGLQHLCPHCGKCFQTEYSLQRHIDTMHLNKGPYMCDKCDKVFSSRGHLLGHQSASHGETKAFKCEKCQKSFSYKKNLQYHLTKVCSKDESVANVGSMICEKTSKAKKYLKRPKSEEKIVCHVCGRNFKWRSSFKEHKKACHTKC